jgi:hypothetical protein
MQLHNVCNKLHNSEVIAPSTALSIGMAMAAFGFDGLKALRGGEFKL